MTSRTITTEVERGLLLKFVGGHPLPFTVNVQKGRKRSVYQNKLQRLWVNEIAEQMGESAEAVRALCKLQFGVPILRAENDYFREKYDAHVKGLPYETKLALMAEPLDFPVTRLMTTEQHMKYLDEIHRHFSEQGLALTSPEPQHD